MKPIWNINNPGLLEMIEELEGKSLETPVLIDNSSGLPALEALREWTDRMKVEVAEEPEWFSEHPIDNTTSTGIIIYGVGGWNRYYVRGDGTVVMSARHAVELYLARAREMNISLA